MSDQSGRLQIDRTLLTASDQAELTHSAVQRILEYAGARTVTMFLYSKKGLLVPVANAGDLPERAEAEAYRPGEDYVGSCAIGGDSTSPYGEMIVLDGALAKTSEQFRRLFGSVLTLNTQVAYIPLNGPNRTYGVIRVIAGRNADGTEKRFSAEDRASLQVFAHQVALSLSSLRRKLELDVLAHVNKLLTDQPEDVLRVYDEVTNTLVQPATQFAACAIRIRDRAGFLELKSISTTPGINMAVKDRLARSPHTGFLGDALARRAPVIVTDVQSRLADFHDPNWVRENGFVTAAFFPIFREEDIGVLSLYLWYPYQFYESKIEFLQSVCHQVATATRVVRLLDSRQGLITGMSAIMWSQSGSTDELLKATLDGACALTGARYGYIAFIDRRSAQLRPRVTERLDIHDVPHIDLNGSGLTALAVRNHRTVRRGDVMSDTVYVDFLGASGGKIASEIVVPLIYEHHILGVIALQSGERNYFSDSDEEMLETLARSAALMFQRNRLYEATETLANVDFSRATGELLLRRIARSAAELIDADAAILRKYTPTNELVLASHYPESLNVEYVPTILTRDEGLCWHALEVRDVVAFNNVTANASFHNAEFATHYGYTEMVSVPLLLPAADSEEPTPLGVINIFFRTPSPFFDVEKRLLRALSVAASYAIHDLAVIEESRRTQVMATITARTTAAVDLARRLAERAVKPLQGARATMESIERAVSRADLEDVPASLRTLREQLRELDIELAPRKTVSSRDHDDAAEGLADAFRFIHTNLFAGSPHLNIGEKELWAHVEAALQRVLELVKLPAAAAFLSVQRDYSDMRRVAVTPASARVVDRVAVPSFDEFTALTEQTHIMLPRADGRFAWLDPQGIMGTLGSVVYGHEVTGGKLLMIVIALPEARTLSFEDLAALYEMVAVQIFTYIDNAMFGIELDFLTSETGHLMGRAIGKVAVGSRELLRGAGEDDNESVDPEILSLAKSAVEDGVNRLHLIHNNFYWFSVQRKMLDGPPLITAAPVSGIAPRIDVRNMLEGMMQLFRREAIERELSAVRFSSSDTKPAVVSGPADPLRLTFLNLYDNAMKFSYIHTSVDIHLSVENGQCVIAFQNLGVGVAPDEFVSIFDRLRRSRYQDRARTREGLGLGLSYCRRVVQEIFRGEIDLYSEPVEARGSRRFEGDNYLTTVTVRLPLADAGGGLSE